jgi:hypothetical protein
VRVVTGIRGETARPVRRATLLSSNSEKSLLLHEHYATATTDSHLWEKLDDWR